MFPHKQGHSPLPFGNFCYRSRACCHGNRSNASNISIWLYNRIEFPTGCIHSSSKLDLSILVFPLTELKQEKESEYLTHRQDQPPANSSRHLLYNFIGCYPFIFSLRNRLLRVSSMQSSRIQSYSSSVFWGILDVRLLVSVWGNIIYPGYQVFKNIHKALN